MFVLNKILLEILKDVKDAVNVNSVELKSADNINCLFVFGIDNTGERHVSSHGIESNIARHGHFIFYQQISFEVVCMKPFIMKFTDVAIEVEIYVTGDAKLIMLFFSFCW